MNKDTCNFIFLGEAVTDSDSQRNREILPCVLQSFADLDIHVLSAKSKFVILSNGCGSIIIKKKNGCGTTYSGCETTEL